MVVLANAYSSCSQTLNRSNVERSEKVRRYCRDSGLLPYMVEQRTCFVLLADQLLFIEQRRLFTPYRPASAIAQLPDIQLQLSDCPAKCVTVHAQFPGGFALVPPVLLQDVHDEALFKFTDGF
jgi:hypothetical protein